MQEPILTVSHIVKRFSGTIALRDVSLSLYPHEILAVMGENGAGKSTLMKILSGIYPYGDYEGEVRVADKLCKFRSPADSETAGIAMIYQELNLELDLTVAENILLGCYPKTKLGFIDWPRVYTEAKTALDKLGTDIDVYAPVRSLSPSMQQLVSIARALYRNPKILILDEPTSVLTEKETETLMDILHTLQKQNIACIYISHKLDEVFKLCERMIILRDGCYISEHIQADGYESTSIIEDMIGRRLDVMYPTADKTIGEEILRVEHFCVAHPFAYGKRIIEDVSFSVRKGEIVGLAGLVGAGRSELASAVFGLTDKLAGTVWFDGKKIESPSPQESIKMGMGFLSEDRKKNGFVWTMDIEQNMTLAILQELRNGLFIDRKKEDAISTEYFDKLRVKAPSKKTLITSLSGGNQQKVIIAKWLMTKLKVLILDEPTRGIDVGTKAEIYKLINDLASQGIGIVMISSELPELIAMCDRFIVLGKGIAQAEISKEDANEVSIMRAASCT
ncbi:MAG: sugar ABC transporter ATP-binding protein [Ruthenibacterium sp.]